MNFNIAGKTVTEKDFIIIALVIICLFAASYGYNLERVIEKYDVTIQECNYELSQAKQFLSPTPQKSMWDFLNVT